MSLLKVFLRREGKKAAQTCVSPKHPRLSPHRWEATQALNDAAAMTRDPHRSHRQPRVCNGEELGTSAQVTQPHSERGARHRPEGRPGGPGFPPQPQGRPGLSTALLGRSPPVGAPKPQHRARLRRLWLSHWCRDRQAELCVFLGGGRGRSGAAPASPVKSRCALSASPARRAAQPGPRRPPRQRTQNKSHTTRHRHWALPRPGTATSGHSPRPCRSELTGNGTGLDTGARASPAAPLRPGPGAREAPPDRPAQPSTARLDSAQRHSPP